MCCVNPTYYVYPTIIVFSPLQQYNSETIKHMNGIFLMQLAGNLVSNQYVGVVIKVSQYGMHKMLIEFTIGIIFLCRKLLTCGSCCFIATVVSCCHVETGA